MARNPRPTNERLSSRIVRSTSSRRHPIPTSVCNRVRVGVIDKAQTFEYSELQDDEIRLLEHVSGSKDGQLCFILNVYKRNAAPPYTALSYTWGTEPADHLMYLNNKPFLVRPNLWQCLCRLQEHLGWSRGNLWIDAICVNQSNVRERNSQVNFMGQTYSNAQLVAIWLGLEDCSAPGCSRSLTWNWTTHMADLIKRPYWSRMWIIQELLLARQIVVLCGRHHINWLDFQRMLSYELPSTLTLFRDGIIGSTMSASGCNPS